ncbi:MAG: hypothetical protein Q7T55_06940, partial [Solirubrobacteraceae bacterium]|nr:hypothetical protein [Solirubrobacteraceae bacterium]
TFGESTLAEVSHHVADWAFLSPVGLHATHGATDYDHAEGALARAMARQARRTAILADHSKLGVLSRVGFCSVEDIDVLVVDHQANKQPALAALRGRVGEILLG